MNKIAICTHFNRLMTNHNIFFPIYRWKKILLHHGIHIDFIKSFNHKRFSKYDTVIIHDRYYRDINGFKNVNEKIVFSKQQFIDFMGELKLNGQRVILYDGADHGGCLYFEFIPFVDKLIKKQIYKDPKDYIENRKSLSVRPFADNPDYFVHDDYVPCPKDQLKKIGIAWNIGMTNLFSSGWMNRLLHNYHFKDLRVLPIPYEHKKLETGFRGTGTGKNCKSFQRNRLIEIFNGMENNKVLIGPPIPFKQYLNELGNCIAMVSPFGGGEICYRDFEIFSRQTLLVKPDVSHLLTYPDCFIENETYLPIKWDLSDLEEKLEQIFSQSNDFRDIAIKGYETFLKEYNDGEKFVKHFLETMTFDSKVYPPLTP
jgi:hypothetical protein